MPHPICRKDMTECMRVDILPMSDPQLIQRLSPFKITYMFSYCALISDDQ